MKILRQTFQCLKRCRKIRCLPVHHVPPKSGVVAGKTGIGGDVLDSAHRLRKRVIAIGGELMAVGFASDCMISRARSATSAGS